MKANENQRGVYLLALGLLVAAIALAGGWSIWGGTDAASNVAVAPSPTATQQVQVETGAVIEPQPTPEADTQKVATVVYYQDNYGYLVPVMCSMNYEDGIAKATLKKMVQSPENDMSAARLGLRCVLPENTTIDLDISGGTARIDLSKEVLKMEDAAAESNMISAIVQTLTEFDSVKKVEFLVGGQKGRHQPGNGGSGRRRRGYGGSQAVFPL